MMLEFGLLAGMVCSMVAHIMAREQQHRRRAEFYLVLGLVLYVLLMLCAKGV